MYPLKTDQPWPVNQWYVAGISTEIGQSLIARTILNRRVILFRDQDGAPRALSGICPHRMMPMEQRKLHGDRVECAYHGLSFSLDGACVAAPTSATLPSCRLQSYLVREAAPLVWIWVGDQELGATTPLPEQTAIGIGADGYRTVVSCYNTLQARYTLLIDNLFDLSHLGFIHASLVGESGIALALAEARIEERDGRLLVVRDMFGLPVDGYHRFLHPTLGERMSTQLESEMVNIGLINAGSPVWDGDDTRGRLLGHMNFAHAVTPETEHTTHYWNLTTRDFRIDDEQLTGALTAQNIAVVEQDLGVLAAIEKLLQQGIDLPDEISMRSDLGALRVRLRIIQMIRQEQVPAAAAAVEKTPVMAE